MLKINSLHTENQFVAKALNNSLFAAQSRRSVSVIPRFDAESSECSLYRLKTRCVLDSASERGMTDTDRLD